MAKTVVIYQDTADGRLRIGNFRYTGTGQGIYAISQAFHKKYPNAHKNGRLYIHRRSKINGKYVDDLQGLPMDPPQA